MYAESVYLRLKMLKHFIIIIRYARKKFEMKIPPKVLQTYCLIEERKKKLDKCSAGVYTARHCK